jgi:Prokaryotic metallothionein
MQCSNCRCTIDPKAAWKGSANRFYCSEFCADAEAQDDFGSGRRVSKNEIDRHYMERLQKLLPHVRRRSGLALGSRSAGIG